jgi:hypothetical protein
MDIKRIKSAFYENAGVAAGGTASTPANAGPGSNASGISPFKARMGTWRRKKTNEQVEQSTQHVSDAQLINPMHETTHEEVNLFDEERIAFSELALTPFTGLQMNDFEAGLVKTFDQIEKIVQYNIANSTDPTNMDEHSLKQKYAVLKRKAINSIDSAIDSIESNGVSEKENDLNVSDAIQLMSLSNAYGDIDGQDPKEYAKKQASRLLDIAKGDALETAKEVLQTQTYVNTVDPNDGFNNVEYLLPSNSSRALMAILTQRAVEGDRWGEALFWNKLRKTIETYNWSDEEKAKAMQQDSSGEEATEPTPSEEPTAVV